SARNDGVLLFPRLVQPMCVVLDEVDEAGHLGIARSGQLFDIALGRTARRFAGGALPNAVGRIVPRVRVAPSGMVGGARTILGEKYRFLRILANLIEQGRKGAAAI